MTRPVGICVVSGAESSEIQAFIAARAGALRKAGLNVVGVAGEEHGLPDRSCGAGFLRDVASDRRFAIYLDEPAAGRTCHIDAEGVAAACACVLPQIADADLVVLNKFGKLEAAGEGLRPVLDAARQAGKPVLLAVSDRHADAFRTLEPDAETIAPEDAAFEAWWDAAEKADARRSG